MYKVIDKQVLKPLDKIPVVYLFLLKIRKIFTFFLIIRYSIKPLQYALSTEISVYPVILF
jgi:hypothetical protein